MRVVVRGCGRVGSWVADGLSRLGHDVAVIDSDGTAFSRLSPDFAGERVLGLGFDREVLLKAGIEEADAFAAVSSGDNSNIISARLAREIFRVPKVVARIYDAKRAEVYERLGIPTIATVPWTTDRLLHALTQDLPLDFFVLYSAAGVVLGAPGQGLYPAANAELDALAWFRRRLGLKALSVAWGVWSGAGMALNLGENGHDVWKARGLRAIDGANGFAQLERLLADDVPYGAVIPIDWRQFLQQLPSGADSGFFAAVVPAKTGSREAGRSADTVTIQDRLRELPSGLRRQALLAELTDRVRVLLGLANDAVVSTKVPLKEIGVDSLMAVELRNILVRSGGMTLPTTLLFDHPTLDALLVFLGRTWGLDETEEALTQPAVRELATSDISDIAGLSEEDAEALLTAELALMAEKLHS